VAKEKLRKHIRQLKRQYTPAQLEQLSLPVIARLRERVKEAQTIMAYYSLPDEVCTHHFIDDLVAEGKTVLLPKVLDATHMELRRYTGSHDLQEGAFGIMEPVGESFTDYASIDVVLVPGIAFDDAGHRLGRGRGYYDRFLRSMETASSSYPLLLGVCFDFQKVSSVPVDVNDIPVDSIIC
jgi:5-formyltetrahydrofolate cyclo-ligase